MNFFYKRIGVLTLDHWSTIDVTVTKTLYDVNFFTSPEGQGRGCESLEPLTVRVGILFLF